MKKDTLPAASEYTKRYERRRFWRRIVAGMACMVVFITAYVLILPAVTMEQQAYCGFEEHQHSAECYEKKLICGYGEEAVEEGEHTHEDSCYEEVLICTKEEHNHELICFSDPDADVEDRSVWENSVSAVKLTGKRADDLTAVAESQRGYTESEKNYIVTGEGEKKGYTRYGEWYGDPYGDWSAMFVSFCLNYAEIPESVVPYDSSCQEWIKKLSSSNDLYRSVSDYTPSKGDIIFLDQEGDGNADHAGIITEVSEDGSSLRAIVGDSEDCVQSVSFESGSSRIHGYASVPENPEYAEETTQAEGTTEEKTEEETGVGKNGSAEAKEENSSEEPANESSTGEPESENAAEEPEAESAEESESESASGESESESVLEESETEDTGGESESESMLEEPESESVAESSSEGETAADENNSGPSEETISEPEGEISAVNSLSLNAVSADSEEISSDNKTISIHVQKQWVGDSASSRPKSIEVTLYADGVATKHTLTLTAANDWSGAFDAFVPKYNDSGEEIKYTIGENGIDNYSLVSSDYTDTESSVDFSTLELWVPVTEAAEGEDYLIVSGLSGSQRLYRAESTVTNGVLSASVTVNEGSVSDMQGNDYTNYIILADEDNSSQYLTWKAAKADENGGMSFQSNVYTYWNGKEKYLAGSGNKLTVEEKNKSGTVFHSDENGGWTADGGSQTLYLFKKVSLDTTSLPVPFYERSYTLINRYEPPISATTEAAMTSVKVTKKWGDGETNHDNDSVTVHLLCDGSGTGKSVVLNQKNEWTAVFSDLLIQNPETNKKYVYSVKEDNVSLYQAEYEYKEVEDSGNYVWLPTDHFEDGVTYLIVTSAATGNVIGLEGQQDGIDWTNGKEGNAGSILVSSNEIYSRYITDEEAKKHTAMQWTAEDKGTQKANQVGTRKVFALKNVKYQKYLQNNGQGKWSDKCTQEATWWYYGYTRIDEAGNTAKRFPSNPESDWAYVLGSMNDYFLLDNNHTGDGGSQAAQTFYLYKRVPEPQLQVTITNHKIEETSLVVLKDWIHDSQEQRPASITIHLLADGVDTGKILTLSKECEWQGQFENLPVRDEAGNTISYTVQEESVDGYISSYFYSSEDGELKVVISNRTQVILPETGGVGTNSYTMGGILLIVIGTFFLLYKHKKHSRKRRKSC